MSRKKETSNAVEILSRRYIKGDPDRKAALEAERVNAEVARMIYDLRTEAGLSQNELAVLIGTTQSVISRLEDADYEGHSLSMLNRIAKALNQRLTVVMTAKDPEVGTLQYAFQAVIQDMRKAKGLTISELAKRTGKADPYSHTRVIDLIHQYLPDIEMAGKRYFLTEGEIDYIVSRLQVKKRAKDY